MKIVFVHGHMFNVHTWSKAREILGKEGIDVHIFSQQQSGEKAVAFLEKEDVDVFVGQLFHDLPWQSELLECAQKARMRAGLGWDMPSAFSTFTDEQQARLERYLNKISVENYVEGIKFLAAVRRRGGRLRSLPVRCAHHGVYHPDAPELFADVSEYYAWIGDRFGQESDRPAVGITCYYGQVLENNSDDIDEVARTLEANGMVPLCVCSEGAGDVALPFEKRYPWLSYFREGASSNTFKLAAVFNMMAGRLLSAPEDSVLFEELNVPVFQTIRLYHKSPEEWEADAGGLASGSFGLVYGLPSRKWRASWNPPWPPAPLRNKTSPWTSGFDATPRPGTNRPPLQASQALARAADPAQLRKKGDHRLEQQPLQGSGGDLRGRSGPGHLRKPRPGDRRVKKGGLRHRRRARRRQGHPGNVF